MLKSVWSTAAKAVTAVRPLIKLWVLRPLVTVIAAFAITIVTAIYAGWTTVPEIWNSETWSN